MFSIGQVVKILDKSNSRYGKHGVIVAVYTRHKDLYATNYGVAFDDKICATDKYSIRSYRHEDLQMMEAGVVPRISLFTLQNLVMGNKITGLSTTPNQQENNMEKRFFICNLERDLPPQLEYSYNFRPTREEAVEQAKSFILKYPTATFHIFEMVTVVKPRQDVIVEEIKPLGKKK